MAYCHKVGKVGSSSVITAQGSLTPLTLARTKLLRHSPSSHSLIPVSLSKLLELSNTKGSLSLLY